MTTATLAMDSSTQGGLNYLFGFLFVVACIAAPFIYWAVNTKGMSDEQKTAHERKVLKAVVAINAAATVGDMLHSRNQRNQQAYEYQRQVGQMQAQAQRQADYQRRYQMWQHRNWNNPNPTAPPMY